jgi:hypothetical protein
MPRFWIGILVAWFWTGTLLAQGGFPKASTVENSEIAFKYGLLRRHVRWIGAAWWVGPGWRRRVRTTASVQAGSVGWEPQPQASHLLFAAVWHAP